MRAGKLRHRIEVQTATETQDAYNQPTAVWATAVTLSGSIEPLSGRERLIAGAVTGEVTTRVRMRYDANITPKARLLHGARVFDIAAVMNREDRDAEVEVLCREAV